MLFSQSVALSPPLSTSIRPLPIRLVRYFLTLPCEAPNKNLDSERKPLVQGEALSANKMSSVRRFVEQVKRVGRSLRDYLARLYRRFNDEAITEMVVCLLYRLARLYRRFNNEAITEKAGRASL